MTEQRFGPDQARQAITRYDTVPDQMLPFDVVTSAAQRIHDEFEASRARVAHLEAQQLLDPKTGLANYEGFISGIEEAIRLPEVQTGEAVVDVVVMDLDHFKNVNDGLGHPAGDDALRQVANVLQSHAQREGDIVAHGMRGARLGGDEFGLVSITRVQDGGGMRADDTPSTGIARDLYTADPLKPILNSDLQRSLAGTQYEPYDLSLSVGRARYRPGLNPAMLLAEADAFARLDKILPRKDRIVDRIMDEEDRVAFINDMLTFDRYEQRRPEPATMAAEELGIELPPPKYLANPESSI